MPEIATPSQIADKWARVTPARQVDYIDGVRTPRRDWADATAGAEENFELGIQNAIANKSFGKGVRRAGTDKWKTRTTEKGPGRWSQGIGLAKSDYEAGFAPFRNVIANLTLPPAGPKGSPQNIERARIMAAALHQAKLDLA